MRLRVGDFVVRPRVRESKGEFFANTMAPTTVVLVSDSIFFHKGPDRASV